MGIWSGLGELSLVGALTFGVWLPQIANCTNWVGGEKREEGL